MKKNATKERLFEVTARLDKTFIPKLNEEVLPTEDKKITTSYQTVTPESAEQGDFADQGWENEEGESMIPDQYDAEDGVTAVDKAVKFLKDNGGNEPSSSQFNTGVSYSTPDPDHNDDYFTKGIEKYYSFHLKGFTPEEEKAIFDKMKTGRNLPEQAVGATQTTGQPAVAGQPAVSQSPDVQYADQTYKMIAPTLQRIRTIDQFPAAFKGWFSMLGYSPQTSSITVSQIRIYVENVMRELGYK
jgi:hypothetical protein